MLSLLRLADFAIVDRAELELGPGLTAITGETGAGKSLLVGALELLVGGRASARVVRAGAQAAEIEAWFDDVKHPIALAALQERGLSLDDGALVVRRVISAGGGRRNYLCGRLASAGDLRAVVGPLVDLCGQHQHSRLLSTDQHLLTLDRFAGLAADRDAYRSAWLRWRQAEGEYARLAEGAQLREQRRDFLAFCAAELEEADVTAGELARLESEARRLHAATELVGATLQGNATLLDDGGVRDVLAPFARRLADLSAIDERLAPVCRQADDLLAQVDELAADLERYADTVDVDESRRAEVDDRLADLLRLIRKYGGSEDALLARREAIERELAEQAQDDGRLGELALALPELKQAAGSRAQALTEGRTAAVEGLTDAAHRVLAALAMPGARLDVAISALPEMGPSGADRVRLMLASNAGEPAQGLAEIASGGELSRVMLALQRACAGVDEPITAVFDEVDAGIGGDTGTRLGAFLAEMARDQQVICITHLPQVAARAVRQLHVSKSEHNGRTVSKVTALGDGERVDALARMLGGDGGTAATHARALLNAKLP